MRSDPLDEFTKKRLGIEDYVLVDDEIRGKYRRVFEAYHDNNEVYTLERYALSVETGERVDENQIYLNYWEAENIIESLQAFVEKCKKRREG